MLLLPISNFLWQKWAESLKTFSSASSCLKTFRQLYRRRSSTFEGGSSRVLFGNHMVPENPIKSHFVMKQISTTSASFSQFNNSETIDLYFTIYFLRNFKKMNEELKVFFVSALFFSELSKGHFFWFFKNLIIVWILLF